MFWRWIGALSGERQAERTHPAGDLQLLGVAALVVGDAVGVGGVGILDRDLHVIQTARGQRLQALAGERHGGGDEIGVEADLGGLRDDLLQVAPDGGLAAGEVQLQHAEVCGLRQHVEPDFGRQLVGDAFQRQRVGAIGALQGTAMRQLGQQADRRRDARGSFCSGRRLYAHTFTTPLSARSCSIEVTSARMRSFGAL